MVDILWLGMIKELLPGGRRVSDVVGSAVSFGQCRGTDVILLTLDFFFFISRKTWKMKPSVVEQCALLSFKVRPGPTAIKFWFQFPQYYQECLELAESTMFNISQKLATCVNPLMRVPTSVVSLCNTT